VTHDLNFALQTHIANVDHRAAISDYPEDADAARRAADTATAVCTRLDLGKFQGRLNVPSGKPQLLLTFQSPSYGAVVLKVYGRMRPREAEVQAQWHAAGIPTADILAAGNDPTSWLLMPHIAGHRPTHQQAMRLTPAVSSITARAHKIHHAPSEHAQDLFSGVAHHLQTVLAASQRHGYPSPPGWEKAAATIYRSGRPTTLHGDLTVNNMLQNPAGRILLLDTCGYIGPTEFDAARWSARTGGSRYALDILNTWLKNEPDLNPTRTENLLGLELLMEAGVREIIKEEHGVDYTVEDNETKSLLEIGAKLMA
jgi:hypothetical protein